MLSKFNDVLSSTEHNTVDAGRTSRTFSYLKECWTYADKEYSDQQSVLFSEETYPEVYDYRGDNAEYESTAYNAMQAWLMAMCLSELCPSHTNDGGMTATNTQTELFKLAYELGGGRDVPLYGNYTLHGDVTISRLAAGAVYALNRKNYTYTDMNVMRKEINGSSINLSGTFATLNFWNPAIGYDNPIWHEMDCKTSSTKVPSEVCPGYNDTKARSLDKLGYAVNTNLIFPNTPGPKIDGTNAASNTHPQEQGQPSSQFNQ
jgi:hypothetical protein